MRIKIATIHDAEKIARNNIMLAEESENKKIQYQNVLKGVRGIITNKEKGFYLVMEGETEILGQIMITYEWSDWRGKDIWWLQSIYVQEKWRGKGIMRKMLEEIKKMTGEYDVYALRLYVHEDNKKAIEAYEHVGMKKSPYYIFSLEI